MGDSDGRLGWETRMGDSDGLGCGQRSALRPLRTRSRPRRAPGIGPGIFAPATPATAAVRIARAEPLSALRGAGPARVNLNLQHTATYDSDRPSPGCRGGSRA